MDIGELVIWIAGTWLVAAFVSGLIHQWQDNHDSILKYNPYHSKMTPEAIAQAYGYYPGWTKELKPRIRVKAGRRVITVRDEIWQ